MKRFMVLVVCAVLSLCMLTGCHPMAPVTADEYELLTLGARLNPYHSKIKPWLGSPPSYDGEPWSFSDENFTIFCERPKWNGAGDYYMSGYMIPTQKTQEAACVPVVYFTCVDQSYRIVTHDSLIVSTEQEDGITKFSFRGSVYVSKPFVWSAVDYFLPM